jgi:hypothetical protein
MMLHVPELRVLGQFIEYRIMVLHIDDKNALVVATREIESSLDPIKISFLSLIYYGMLPKTQNIYSLILPFRQYHKQPKFLSLSHLAAFRIKRHQAQRYHLSQLDPKIVPLTKVV